MSLAAQVVGAKISPKLTNPVAYLQQIVHRYALTFHLIYGIIRYRIKNLGLANDMDRSTQAFKHVRSFGK